MFSKHPVHLDPWPTLPLAAVLLLALVIPVSRATELEAPADAKPARVEQPPPEEPTGDPGNGTGVEGNAPDEREPDGPDASQRPAEPEGPEPQPGDGVPTDANPGESNTFGEPVNLFNGNFSHSRQDLFVPGRRLPLKLTRDYNTADIVERAFGRGWSSLLAVALFETTDGVEQFAVVRLSTDERLDFRRGPDGSYLTPSGRRDTLVRQEAGWVLTRPWKNCYDFDAEGRLLRLRDPNGNSVQLERDSAGRVTRVSGAGAGTLTFRYSLRGRVQSVEDPAGGVFRYAYDARDRLTSATDPAGRAIRYGYDELDRMTTIADAGGTVWLVNIYDASGRVLEQWMNGGAWGYRYNANPPTVTEVIDPRLGRTVHELDKRGRLVARTRPLGGRATQRWSPSGFVEQTVDADGVGVLYSYDATGNATSVSGGSSRNLATRHDQVSRFPAEATDPLGRKVTASFDSRGNPVETRSPTGSHRLTWDAFGQMVRDEVALDAARPSILTTVLELEYDEAGRIVKRGLPGAYCRWQYDALGRVTSSTGPSGATTRYTYDRGGYLVARVSPGNRETRYVHDSAGDLVASQDPEGRWMRFEYDPFHRLVAAVDPAGGSYRLSRDAAGALASFTDRAGGQTHLTRDANGRVVSRIDPSGAELRYEYTTRGRLRTRIDPVGNRTGFEHGLDGRLAGKTLATSRALSVVRDASGRGSALGADDSPMLMSTAFSGTVTAVSDATGVSVSFEADGLDRVVRQRASNGAAVTYGFDTRGHVESVVNGQGQGYRLVRDPMARTVATVDTAGVALTSTFDSSGLLVRLSNAMAHEQRFERDRLGRVTRIVDADGVAVAYEYDLSGNVSRRTDGLGRTVELRHDREGRRTAVVSPLGAETRFEYDPAGRLARIVHPGGGEETMQNDAAGRVVSRSNGASEVVTYAYDALGRVRARGLPDGVTILLERDREGRLVLASGPLGEVAFEYDAASRVTVERAAAAQGRPAADLVSTYDTGGLRASLTYPDGLAVAFARDPSGRLSRLTMPGASLEISFTHDSGARPSVIEYSGAASSTFVYDAAGRIVSVRHSTATSAEFLRLDTTLSAGGRVVRNIENGAVCQFTHDAAGQLLSASMARPATEEAHAFDADGNRTSAGASFELGGRIVSDALFVYTHDGAGRLIRASSRTGPLVVRYSYDAENRLLKVERLADGVGVESVVSFAYDALGRRVRKTVDDANTHYLYQGPRLVAEYDGTGTLVAKYVHAEDRLGPVAMVRDGRTYYYLRDRLGSVRAVVRDDGVPVNRYGYSSFGVPLERIEGVDNPFLYAGGVYDAETGLHFFRNRYYDPRLGRFLTPDRIFQTSPYAYAGNDPVDFLDPEGELIGTLIGGAVGFLVGGAAAVVKGEDPLAGALGGLTSGLIAGAVVDLTVATGGAGTVVVVASVAGGALGNSAGKLVENNIANETLKQEGKPEKDVLDGVGTAAVTGALTGGIIKGAGGATGGIAKEFEEALLEQGFKQGAAKALGETEEALADELIDTALQTVAEPFTKERDPEPPDPQPDSTLPDNLRGKSGEVP